MARVLGFPPRPTPGVRWPSPTEVTPFGGSLQGATEAEVQARAVEQNPMRLLCRLVCGTCGHRWQQPSNTGACPACHGTELALIESIPCMAQRV